MVSVSVSAYSRAASEFSVHGVPEGSGLAVPGRAALPQPWCPPLRGLRGRPQALTGGPPRVQGVDRIQFDVMDGNFVPNLTFGPEMIAACRKYCGTPFETQVSRPAEPPAAGARRAPFGLTRPRPRRRS